MDSSSSGALIQLMPSIILGLIYAALVFVVARKRRINPWGWTIASLIPIIGLLVSAVFFYTTLLSILDRLNQLESTKSFE